MDRMILANVLVCLVVAALIAISAMSADPLACLPDGRWC
jgi:hypothetical protein